MLKKALALLALLPATVLGAPASLEPRALTCPAGNPNNLVIFTPPSTYGTPRVLYTRTVTLSSGVILATWENYSPEPPLVYFPIYQSTDNGASWKQISKVTDTVNGWGLRYQPFLYELPQAIGNLPAGTVLLAGNSIPKDLSKTKIDIYASFDKGYTWKFVSHVASGGKAVPNNGETPVWEPFLMVYNNQLVCYYSDQRDPAYGQKLVHQVSSNGVSWGPVVNDVAVAPYTARPGMTTIAKLPNGKYIITYEYGGGPGLGTSGYHFPVYYRISSNPLNFNAATGYPVKAADGTIPTGSPYVVWSPSGGSNGSIIVSGGGRAELFINRALGDASKWEMVGTNVPKSYTRSLGLLKDQNKLIVMGAGGLPPSTTNAIKLSVLDVKKCEGL